MPESWKALRRIMQDTKRDLDFVDTLRKLGLPEDEYRQIENRAKRLRVLAEHHLKECQS